MVVHDGADAVGEDGAVGIVVLEVAAARGSGGRTW